MLELFAGDPPWQEPLAEGAVVLRRFAYDNALALLTSLHRVAAQSPFRHLITPGGRQMSVAMTNCGVYGWCSSSRGYQYTKQDPLTGCGWPTMPENFCRLACCAAECAGFSGFSADAALINRYQPGAKLSLHQDKDEKDLTQPIVSVSLGLPVLFQFGGWKRSDLVRRILLEHGDVVVWGGASRLRFHGVLPLKAGVHPVTDAFRYNITLRRAS